MVKIVGNSNDVGYYEACSNSLLNQLFITLPSMTSLLSFYPIEVNNWLISIAFIPCCVILGDIWFYIIHRLLHSKLFWNYHKFHHKFPVHVATALDAHPLEHFTGNLLSIGLGPLCLLLYTPMNIYILNLWVFLTTLNSCKTHCPYFHNSLHLNHHHFLKCNYGFGFYIIDRLMNTLRE